MSQEEKKDMIVNILSEVLAEVRQPGAALTDVSQKLEKMAQSVGSDFVEIYDRSTAILKKHAA